MLILDTTAALCKNVRVTSNEQRNALIIVSADDDADDDDDVQRVGMRGPAFSLALPPDFTVEQGNVTWDFAGWSGVGLPGRTAVRTGR
jgi:hypothetical protein